MREDGRREGYILGKTPGADTILLFDDLEGLLKWGAYTPWGVPRGSKSANAAYEGSWGLELSVRRSVPDGFQYVGWARLLPIVKYGRLRCECVAQCPAVNGQDGFGIALIWYDGTYRNEARLAYESVSDYVLFYGEGCSWEDTGLTRVGRANGAWHHIFIEVDRHKEEYCGVGIDSSDVDLSGVKFCRTVDAGAIACYVVVFVAVYFTGTRSGYFDNVLVRSF